MGNRILSKWLISIAAIALYTPLTFGLGLGEITIHSKLNQALDAEIEITSATSEELADLTLSIPSEDAFKRYDLERLGVFSSVRFQVENRPNNRKVIRAVSYEVIKDPFLTFLIQADWPQGRMLREYTVFVDPPLFVPSPTPTTGQASTTQTQPYIAPAVTNTRTTDSSQGVVDRQATSTPRTRSAETRSAQTRTTDSRISSSLGDSYRVRRGDTLWEIANDLKPDDSFTVNQTMMAIYRNNASAFDGNINRLKSGYVLRIPDSAEVSRITRESANSEVSSQARSWRSSLSTRLSSTKTATDNASAGSSSAGSTTTQADSQDPQLKSDGTLVLKVPDLKSDMGTDARGGTTDSTTGTGNAAGEARIRELQTKVEEFERLLAAKDNELASLQDQLGEQYQLGTDTSMSSVLTLDENKSPSSGTDSATDVQTDVKTDQSITDAQDTATTPEVKATPEVKTTPDVVPVVEVDSSSSSSFMQYLKPVGIGFVSLLLLGLLGLFGYKKLNKGPSHDTLFVDEDLDLTAESIAEKVKSKINKKYQEAGATSEMEVSGVDFGQPMEDEPVLNLEPPASDDGDEVDFNFGGDLEDAEQDIATTMDTEALQIEGSLESGEALPFDDTTLADVSTGSMSLDQNDPLAETDFHMAYGLYDQAAELMQGALEKEDKFAYKEKLLEVYFVSGNKDEFMRFVNEIKDEAKSKHSSAWDNIVIMGKQLAPEEEIFKGDMSAAGLDEGLDFSLGETGNIDVDQSLFEDLPAAPDAAAELDFELGEDVLDFSEVEASAEADVSTEDAQAVSENLIDDDALDLDLDLNLPDAPVDLEEAIEDFSFDLDATMDTAVSEEDLMASASVDAGESPLAGWESSDEDSVEVIERTMDIDPTLIQRLSDVEGIDKTEEIKIADLLDMDIGSDTKTSALPDLDLSTESGDADSSMDLDLSDMGFTAEDSSDFEDESEDTFDFSFDLDKSDDINIESNDLSSDMLNEFSPDSSSSTKKLDVADSFDLLLDDNNEDTANAALDVDLDAMLSENSDEEFADDTLRSMLPEGVDEHDSGTMQLSSIKKSTPDINLSEVFNSDDSHSSTARISDDDLAAMGLSDEGPEDLMGGMNFDSDSGSVDEFSTKLDLARAYIEMDDPDNAKSILQEVIEEGNDNQRKEAQDIILTLS